MPEILRNVEETNESQPDQLEIQAANDMEIAMFYCKHIDEPCDAKVSPGKTENIRHFYIGEAKRLLENMANPDAIKILHDKIKEYENEPKKRFPINRICCVCGRDMGTKGVSDREGEVTHTYCADCLKKELKKMGQAQNN